MKLKNKTMIFAFSLILILSLSAVSAGEDTDSVSVDETDIDDISVDQTTDELNAENIIYISPNGTGSGSSEADPTNWNTALNKAGSGSVIQFANGTYYDIKNDYISNVELRGSGNTIINASGDDGFFATYGSVTLKKLSFVDAYTGKKQGNPDGPKTGYDGKGAIENNGQLTVIDCYFASNQGIGTEGGAIHNYNHCEIYNSTFYGNGGKKGGAIYCDEGSSLYIYNSLVQRCVSREGSAIHAKKANIVEVHNCTVRDSSAKNGLFYVKESTVKLFDSYFYNSKAVDSAGVINIDKNSYVEVDNCVFDKISSTGTKLWFHEEYGSGDGGVIVVEKDAKNVVIKNSIFTNCSAKGYGGVMYVDSSASITLDNCTFKSNTATYGNNIYSARYASMLSIINSNFEVTSTIEITDIDYGQTEVIKATFDDGTNNLLNPVYAVLVNGKEYSLTSGSLSIPDLAAGNYTAVLVGNDYNSNRYTFTEPSSVFVVGGENIEVTVTYAISSDGSINVKVVDEYGRNVANKQINIAINNVNYTSTTDKNGIAVISPDLSEGEYDVSVRVNGKVISNKTSTKITIANSTTPMTDVVNVDFSYVDDGSINVEVKDEFGRVIANTDVTLTINGETYTQTTDSNGIANIIPSKTVAGEKVSSSSPATVKVMPTGSISSIVASDITRGYKSSYDFKARFLDKNANYLKNKVVTFVLNGNDYEVTTDEYGFAVFANNLTKGVYNITAINPATAQSKTYQITIVDRISGNKNINMDYSYSATYNVRVFADNGNPAGAGENVVIKIDGKKVKDVKTDANGYATYTVKNNNLAVKTHIITAEYKGVSVTNKMVVKQILKSKNVNVKKSVKTKKFTATLKTSAGKAIKNKKITFKIKGKTYSAKTNKKGVSTIKVANSLKVGKYTVTIKYLKTSIKKTLTIKK